MLSSCESGQGIIIASTWQRLDTWLSIQDDVKEKVKQEHDKATADNLVDKLVVWSGSSVGLITSIQHAENVVNDLIRTVKLVLMKNAQLVTQPNAQRQDS